MADAGATWRAINAASTTKVHCRTWGRRGWCPGSIAQGAGCKIFPNRRLRPDFRQPRLKSGSPECVQVERALGAIQIDGDEDVRRMGVYGGRLPLAYWNRSHTASFTRGDEVQASQRTVVRAHLHFDSLLWSEPVLPTDGVAASYTSRSSR